MGKKKGRVLNGASPRTATNSAMCLLRVGVDLGGLFDLVLSDTFASNMMRSDAFRETRALPMFDLVLVPDVSFGGLVLLLQRLGSIFSRLERCLFPAGCGAAIRTPRASMSLLHPGTIGAHP